MLRTHASHGSVPLQSFEGVNAGPARDGANFFFVWNTGGCVDRQGCAGETCHKHVDIDSVLLTTVYCLCMGNTALWT